MTAGAMTAGKGWSEAMAQLHSRGCASLAPALRASGPAVGSRAHSAIAVRAVSATATRSLGIRCAAEMTWLSRPAWGRDRPQGAYASQRTQMLWKKVRHKMGVPD